ncbi:MAG: MFS transporter [Gemmatimonadales bacterium]
MTSPSSGRPGRLPLGALRHRNFRLFSIGQFISLSGTWMQQVAVAWMVLQLTDSAFSVGLVTTLGGLPMAMFTLYAGVLADRVDKRRFLLIIQSLMLVVAATLAVLTLADAITLMWIMVLVACTGVLVAFEVPTRQAFVVEMVGKDDLIHAIAINSSVFNATRVVGPAIAGALIAVAGVAAAFVVNAVSFVAVLAALLAMRFPPETRVPVEVNAREAFREGMRFVLERPGPRRLILLTGVVSIFGSSFVVMLPVLARDALGVGAEGYGILVAATGVGSLAGALILAAFGGRLPRQRLIFLGAGTLGLVLVVVGWIPWFGATVAALAVAGCALIFTYVNINTVLQIQAPDHLRGRVMGFFAFMALGLSPLGAFQIGWMSEHFGVAWAISLGGIITVAAAVWLARSHLSPPPPTR